MTRTCHSSIAILFAVAGCSCRSHPACQTADAGATIEWRQFSASTTDLIFVIGNSPSMAEEQANLRTNIPRLIGALVDPPRDPSGLPLYPPAEDVHVGIVSTDLGSGPFGISGCHDDGSLFIDAYRVAPTDPSYDRACDHAFPRFLSWIRPRAHLPTGATCLCPIGCSSDGSCYANTDLVRDVACLASLGTEGCGIQQPLEAAYQALTTHLSLGDNRNNIVGNDFLRPTSLLVLVAITDQEDCSIRDYTILDPSRTDLGPLGTRCLFHPEYLHPVARYADGLSVDVYPPHSVGRIVLSVVAGIPLDLGGSDPLAILADARMQYAVDSWGSIQPSCSAAGVGTAAPARRLVETLAPFYAAGNALAWPICSSDLGPAMDPAWRLITRPEFGRCLAEALPADPACAADCRVTERLAPGATACSVGQSCPQDCLAATGNACTPDDASCGRVVANPYLGDAPALECTIPQVTPPPGTSLCDCTDHPTDQTSACQTDARYNGWFYDPNDLAACPVSTPQFGKFFFLGTGVPVDGSTVFIRCGPPPPCP